MLRSCFDSPPYQAISCRAGFLWAAAPSPNWLCPLHCTTPVCSPWSRNRCRIGLINHSWSALAWRAIWVLQAYGVIPWGTKRKEGRFVVALVLDETCLWSLKLPSLFRAQPIWTGSIHPLGSLSPPPTFSNSPELTWCTLLAWREREDDLRRNKSYLGLQQGHGQIFDHEFMAEQQNSD